MFKRRQTDKKRIEAESVEDAVDYLLAGLKWFLIHKTTKTLFVILVVAGSTLFVVLRYFYKPSSFDKQKTELSIPQK